MVAFGTFLDHIPPPTEHGVEHGDNATKQDPNPTWDLPDVEQESGDQNNGTETADKWPRTWVDQMIVVVHVVVVVSVGGCVRRRSHRSFSYFFWSKS